MADYDLSKFVPEKPTTFKLPEGEFVPEQKSNPLRRVADVGVDALKGAVGLPESIVGLADIPTGGLAGKAAEGLGIRFKDAKTALDEMYSPERQRANKALADTKGFIPTIGTALANPSTILGAAVESAPSMLGGAAIGRGALSALSSRVMLGDSSLKAAQLGAAALGEGAVSAGQTAEQVRQETPSGTLTPTQAGLAAGAGAITGGLNRVGGAVAKKLGISDIDTALVTGKLAPGTGGVAGTAKRIGQGVLSEGVLEELPQSAQEQVAQNLALGKPWNEGVAEAAAMGSLVGGLMGAGANVLHGNPAADARAAGEQPPADVAPPLNEVPVTAPDSAATGLGGPSEGGGAEAGQNIADRTPPVIRDEAGQSVHPQDVAAQVAAAQPSAGPLTQAAGIAATPIDGPSATEASRLQAAQAEVEANAGEQEKAAQAAQEALQATQEQAVADDRAKRLGTILSDKKNAALTQSAEQELGPLTSDDHRAIRAELTTRRLAAQEAKAAEDLRKAEKSTTSSGKTDTVQTSSIAGVKADEGIQQPELRETGSNATTKDRQRPSEASDTAAPALDGRAATRAIRANEGTSRNGRVDSPNAREEAAGGNGSANPRDQAGEKAGQSLPSQGGSVLASDNAGRRQAGASVGNGAGIGTTAPQRGDRSSQKRGHAGQSPGKPRGHEPGGALPSPRDRSGVGVQASEAGAVVSEVRPVSEVRDNGATPRSTGLLRPVSVPSAETDRQTVGAANQAPATPPIAGDLPASSAAPRAEVAQTNPVSDVSPAGPVQSAASLTPVPASVVGAPNSDSSASSTEGAGTLAQSKPADNRTAATQETKSAKTQQVRAPRAPSGTKGASNSADVVSAADRTDVPAGTTAATKPMVGGAANGGVSERATDRGSGVVLQNGGQVRGDVAARSAAITTDNAQADALKAAHETIVKAKGQTTAIQRRIIDSAAADAKAIREGQTPTKELADKLRRKAETIAKWDDKAAAAVRVLADYVDSVRPKSALEQKRAEKVAAEAKAKADREAAKPKRLEQRAAESRQAAEVVSKASKPDIESLRSHIGWAERGGKIIREAGDPEAMAKGAVGDGQGEVVGRTKWIPHSPFWPDRPEKISEAEGRTALDKFAKGETLTPKETRFIAYADQYVKEQNAADAALREKYDAQTLSDSGYDALSPEAQDAVATSIDDAFAMGKEMNDAEVQDWLNEGVTQAGTVAASGASEGETSDRQFALQQQTQADLAAKEQRDRQPESVKTVVDRERAGFGLSPPAGAVTQAPETNPKNQQSLGNRSVPTQALTGLNRSLYDTVANGETNVRPLLERIVTQSASPLNRAVAGVLLRAKINARIELGDLEGLSFPVKDTGDFTAAYIPSQNLIRLINPVRVEQDIIHEAMHAGTYAALRKNGMAARQMETLFNHVKAFGMLDPSQYGLENVDEFVAEAFSNPEFQAHLKAIPARRGLGSVQTSWQWFVSLVRSILGLSPQSDNALSQALTVGSALIEEGMKATVPVQEMAVANRSQQGTDAFRKWFGDSKVVDAEGKPLVVYHGTDVDLTQFDRGTIKKRFPYSIGFHFTDRPGEASVYADSVTNAATGFDPKSQFAKAPLEGGNVLPVYVKIENPLVINGTFKNQPASSEADLNRADIIRKLVEAQNAGKPYDGVIIRRAAGDGYDGVNVIAFQPEQIKSATGNAGTFDPANPSILFNRHDVRGPDGKFHPIVTPATVTNSAFDSAKDLLSTFKSDRVLNRVISKFNTPDHLAQLHPKFKPVYDEAQDFNRDISRYTKDAADLAPDLLVTIESMADFKKKAPTNPDVKALSDAIYAGTLYGGGSPLEGKRWTAGELKSGKDAETGLPLFAPLNDAQVKLYEQAMAATGQALSDNAKSLVTRLARLRGYSINTEGALDQVVAEAKQQADEELAELNTAHAAELEQLREQINGLTARDFELDSGAKAKLEQKIESRKASNGAAREEIAGFKASIEDIQAKTDTLIDKGYFPAMRHGKYAVLAESVKDGKRETLAFSRFETQMAANLAKREWAKEYPDAEIKSSVMNDEAHKLFQGLNLDALELFAEHMVDDQGQPIARDPVMQEYFRVAASERSTLKRQIKRKGIAGYSTDIPRNLAQFVVSQATSTSRNFHSAEMLKHVRDIKAGDLQQYATRYVRYLQDPQEEAALLRGALANYYILGSLAFGAVNMTQPILTTAPVLSQHTGWTSAMAELGKAAKDMVTGKKTLTSDERKAYDSAAARGIVSPQEIHQIRADSRASALGDNPLWNKLESLAESKGVTLPGKLALRKAVFLWGSIYSLTEQFNRGTSFLAAYRIAKAKGMADPQAFAEQVVSDSQFTMNRANRNEVSRGPVGSVVMTFKSFSVQYLQLAKRLYNTDKKAFAVMMLTLMAGAGAGGLPFSDDLADLVDTIGQWMGFATNSKKSVRQWAEKTLGQDIANLVQFGVSGIPGMPIDVANRLGMHNIIPGSALLKTAEPDKTRDIIDVLGPAATLFKNVGSAVEGVATGKPGELLSLLPMALQNAAQGGQMFETGAYRDKLGRKVMDVDAVDSAFKLIGFQPNKVAQESRIIGQNQQDKDLQKVMESSIVGRLAQAIVERDPALREKAMRELQAWNQTNPELRILITPQQIQQRARGMLETREQRTIRNTAPELRGGLIADLRR